MKKQTNIKDLVELMQRLRGEDGCPWDKKQTPQSLTTYIIEEAYELVEAIEQGEPEKICEELGDLLFQIIFQAQIFSERGQFNLDDVIERIYQKMIYRHPHVFGDKRVEKPEEVKKQWVELKQKSHPQKSVLGDVPRSLPALLRARKITDNASQVGFDWENTEQVLGKVEEEWQELTKAFQSKEQSRIEQEFGDLLFALVNLSRFVGVNPETALKQATEKFEKRFAYIEEQAQKQGKNLKEMPLKEMDSLWEEAKNKGIA